MTHTIYFRVTLKAGKSGCALIQSCSKGPRWVDVKGRKASQWKNIKRPFAQQTTVKPYLRLCGKESLRLSAIEENMEVGQQMMNRDPFGRLDLSLAQNNEYFTIGHTEATTVTIRPFRPFKTSQEPHGKGQKSRPALLFLHIELYLKVSSRKTTFFLFCPKSNCNSCFERTVFFFILRHSWI